MTKSIVRLCTLGCILATLAACSPNPKIGEAAATTPDTFSEARAMYLGDTDAMYDVHGRKVVEAPKAPKYETNEGPNVDSKRPLRQLLFPFQANRTLDQTYENLVQELEVSGAVPLTAPATATEVVKSQTREKSYAARLKEAGFSPKQVLAEYYVLHNQPLSVIVNKVITPPDFDSEGRVLRGSEARTRDVALILYIQSMEQESVEPLVVWYQRDVPAGDALNFEHLIVYHNPIWDSKIPPYFRIQLLDVKTEDNAVTRRLLDRVSGYAGALGAFVPHPALPIVQLGIEAGKQILGNQANIVLMDYGVQFYAAEDRSTAGGADLGYLRKGHWLVTGKKSDQFADFWESSLFMDQRTMRIYSAAETKNGQMRFVGVPSVLMTITTSESVVPSITLDRSRELTKLLTATPESQDFDALSSKISSVNSSLKTYIASRRVQKEQNGEAMTALVEMLRSHNNASKLNASKDIADNKLTSSDVSVALLTIERATGRNFSTTDEVITWWDNGLPTANPPAPPGKNGRYQFVPDLGKSIWK